MNLLSQERITELSGEIVATLAHKRHYRDGVNNRGTK